MLIVEDGTGKEDSEVYLSVAEADEYFAKRNNLEWADLTEPEKEAALRKGSDYILQVYREKWAGYRTKVIQAMDWPRAYVKRDDAIDSNLYVDVLPNAERVYYPEDFIPREIKAANAELALLSITEDLLYSTERFTTDEAIGSIKVSYDKGAPDKRRFPAVHGLLRPFLKSSGSNQIVRG